ncbi:cysteine-rich receptor-like protein kinase 3 [Dioscorea cayenensis subsp. rotundata]|uniref:Cysteine-rich receptor-like protein kinase 3 n=1 Tax=Dioscorea cayennensis subsp. rotundata TaxID=55577 RepID=A0AB40BKX2_DIOCR|nr:cysteine-rich receptor-like protein kinase 3 [Dioscorea cayenensis subsp. rotundata]
MAPLLLVFLLFSLSGADNTSPEILLTLCGSNKTSNAQAFDINFVNSMELIYQNITDHGYGVAVSGTSDTVFGIGQCFNYLSSVNCQLCYAESRVKLPHCLPATDSRIYLDGCFLRYSDRNVSTQSTDLKDTSICGNSSTVIPSTSTVTSLLKNITEAALNNSNYYAAASASVSSDLTVYGMAQCWKSLNLSGCRDCLEKAVSNVSHCLPASDGKGLNAGCFVRYSTEPFYLSSSSSGGGSSSGRILAVVLGCVAAAVVVIGVAIWWMRRRGAHDSSDDEDGSGEFIRSIAGSHLSFKYEVLSKATDNFSQINKLGHGGYGSVYKGVLPDGREVAVKRLFLNTRQWVDQFFNEVSLISQVQHKNLVKLLGCSVEGPESLLVYEYLCNTSLDKFLFDSFKKTALDWERRFDIILGTAEGIAYLHTAAQVRIIHRDIKASNVLLDERFRPKIADFGLARYFAEGQSHLSTGLAGTFGYMAPEYIVHGQLSEKADTYSYGILVLEIITGRKNQNSVATSTDGHSLISLIWKHYTEKTLIELLDPNLQGQCSEEQALKIFHIGLLCAQASSGLRPHMWKVVEMLMSKSQDLPLPTQPPFINIKGADVCSSSGSGSSYKYTSSSKSGHSVNQMSVSQMQGR